VLSTVPRVSIFKDQPVIIEPYYVTYIHQLGKFDVEGVLARVRQEFEAVIRTVRPPQFRGVPNVPPDLWSAIVQAYEPFGAAGPTLVVRLPRGTQQSPIGAGLKELGCASDDSINSGPALATP
jgi:hypothetical protein